MGRCSCNGNPCTCSITSTNDNITVTGSGTVGDPYDINVAINPAADNEIQETASGLYVPGLTDKVRVFRSANLEIANATDTKIDFDQVRWEEGNLFDLAADDRLTVQEDGIYHCYLHVEFEANVNGWRTIFIYFPNDTLRIAEDHRPASSASFGSVMSIGTDWVFEAGDFIEAWAWQDSGGLLDLLSTPAKSIEFGMTKIRQ